MANFMRQCTLNRGRAQTVSWIPEKFATVGKVLALKDRAGEWTDGWEVAAVGGRLEASVVNERSQEYKKHRNSTDI